jgi:hypothetical protein
LTWACVWIALTACAQEKSALRRGPAEVQVPATVITVETRVQPDNHTFRHRIIIAGGLARSDDEFDRWRLFDFANQRVTWVDDIARTLRSQPLEDAASERRKAAEGPVPDHAPRAEFIRTGVTRTVAGVPTTQVIVRAGGYEREMWIGQPQNVPAGLFAAFFATEPADGKYEPIMREVDDALLDLRGFPMTDHAELPYGESKLVVDRNVVRIERKNVPQSLLQVDSTYREITAPGENLPPGASPPPGRNTPEGESQSSSTTRRNP